MGALIVLFCLIIILFFYLLISLNNKADSNNESLSQIKNQLKKVTDQLDALQKQPGTIISKEEKTVIIVEEKIQPEQKLAIPVPPVQKPKEEKIKPEPEFVTEEDFDDRILTEGTPKIKKQKKNTDYEKFIGENLANKIGIAVLVLGISFFVKYAIDNDWINETGRVAIGFVSGGILIGIAHYIRSKYRSFSSVLIGGGLTVFYFTTAYAFHQYQLIGQQPAFIIMVVISAFAVILSLYYDRQELAIIATIGGFVTPFLVSTGQENYIALFTYLSILNSALMVLAWFKRWPAINTIALFFTTIIFGGWVINRTIFKDSLPYKDAFLFGTIFYLLFITMNIVNNIRLKNSFRSLEFIIVLGVNLLYYITGIYITDNYSPELKGLFTLSLGVFNLVLYLVFNRNKQIDRNFISLLIGITLSFFSLAPFVQFKGSTITLFWAAEMVVLYWLYQRSRLIHLKIASLLLCILMIFGTMGTWIHIRIPISQDVLTPIIINKQFITTIGAAISLFIYYLLLRKEKEYMSGAPTNSIANAVYIAAFIFVFAAGFWEIDHQISTRYPGTRIYTQYLQAYSFATAVIVLQLRKRSIYYPLLKYLLTGLSLAIYLLSLTTNYKVSSEFLSSPYKSLFIAHWVAAALLLWLLADLVRYYVTQKNNKLAEFRTPFTWIASLSIIILLSVEMYHVLLWTHPGSENDLVWWQNLYYKAGLSILWSFCSFIMIWLGIKNNYQPLRIIGLTLFTITLIKLFFYDIRNIPPGGKIAAFILLGILLLTVSFMYQRLKKILIDKPET